MGEPSLRLPSPGRLPAGRRKDVDPDRPLLSRLELDVEPCSPALNVSGLREEDMRAAEVSIRGREDERFPIAVEARVAQRRERVGVHRVAKCEVVLLDRKDVREVVCELELERERQRATRMTTNDERVLHALADAPCSRDCQLVGAEPAGDRVAHEEGRAVRL